LEIGRQLTVLGREVALVVLLDTLPLERKHTTFAKRLQIHLDNLRRIRSIRVLSQYVAGRLRALYVRFLRRRAVGNTGEIGVPSLAQLSAGEVAQAIYHPSPYPGDVLLIQAKERDWYVDWDPMLSWREAIQGRLRVVEIDAGHDSLIEKPAAGEVARLLSEALKNL
jgi:thioesterase domain-containing protein